ncbi:beta strand repeat-containing protein [Sulfurimonas sp.]|uniref:beta strand repeat-containing protein n=1 Tax=Sulfurimonas sp. TaxID=2022749 RepID=UPI003D0A7D91
MKLSHKLLSIAAATVLTATLTGCNSDTSTSTSDTGSAAQHITNPKGSVTGLVQDTNGNPLAGATIYLAGKSTTTDAGGVYLFSDVPVTNTQSTGSSTEATQALSITIVPPTGYIGATVTVTPLAQINGAEDSSTNAVETFIDGYIASAGTAVLPATDSTVTGVLRDANTGEPLASQEVDFEFTYGGTSGVAQEQEQDGVTTSYAVSTYKVTTGTDGSFSFASLPSDSYFTVLVPGYNVSKSFSSTGEDQITLGNVLATAITALDTVHPYIVSVDNVISNSSRAMLDDDTRDTFVVNFSETLDASKMELAGNSLLLYTGAAGALQSTSYTASIDSTNKIITVSTTATLNDGDYVDILFLNADVADTSANTLTLNGDIAYDSTVSNYTKVQLQIFEEADTNASAATSYSQLTSDSLGEDDDEAVQAKSDAFTDVLDETAGFQQLNSADDDDGLNGADSAQRLNALAQALGASGVTVGQTRITFTPTGAYGYFVQVTDKSATAKVQSNVIGVTDALTDNIDTTNSADFDGTATLTLLPTDTNPVEVYLSNVEPTDIVTITPFDSLGYMGTAVTITLEDNVAPTTILQKSYFAGTATSDENSSGTVVQFGDGGELADTNGELVVGTPYLALNNSLLDNEDASGENVSTGVTPDQTLKTELFDLSVIDDDTSLPYIDGTGAYDAQAIAAFNQDSALARTMGVAFSEDIETIGSTPTFNGTATVDGWTINNDVIINVHGQTVNADLIDMDVSNILTLANTDHNSVIDYSGITDSTGNAASSATNAAVVIKDEMAPMVLSATYNESSSNVVITFNEAIALTDSATSPAVNSVVVLSNGATATYSASATENQWSLNSDATVLTIPEAAFDSTVNSRTQWSAAAYPYPDDNYGQGTDVDVNHLGLDFSAISDVHGNSWDSYATNTGTRATTAPYFMIAEIPSNFGANIPTFGATDTTTNAQTVTWTFNQPIRIDNAADIFYGVTPNASGVYIISAATDLSAIQDAFTGVIDPDGAETLDAITNADVSNPTMLTLSANRKVVTLRFTTTTDLTSTLDDIVRLNTKTIVSDGDIDQSLSGEGVRAAAQ